MNNDKHLAQQHDGQHILAEFWQCDCHSRWLCRSEPLLSTLKQAIADVGLTLVGHSAHEFHPLPNSNSAATPTQTTGVTISLLLAESHLCLHTWGEQQAVTLDIYVCNVLNDNSEKAAQLFDVCHAIFQPKDYHTQTIRRAHVRACPDTKPNNIVS